MSFPQNTFETITVLWCGHCYTLSPLAAGVQEARGPERGDEISSLLKTCSSCWTGVCDCVVIRHGCSILSLSETKSAKFSPARAGQKIPRNFFFDPKIFLQKSVPFESFPSQDTHCIALLTAFFLSFASKAVPSMSWCTVESDPGTQAGTYALLCTMTQTASARVCPCN